MRLRVSIAVGLAVLAGLVEVALICQACLAQDYCQPAKLFKPSTDEDILYYRSQKGWTTTVPSERVYFRDQTTEGMFVEIPMGTTGLHPVSAILVRYDKFKDDSNLIAFNKNKNIALLYFDRWNTTALCLSSPDADELLKNAGFQCSPLDVVRLLRLNYRR